ncbi:unnamed protein product [Periconia digitata]|uniref:Uncharacterized protein n=1 Tax=Periconia digitata TaxID=1303443 RepID=A0A9W4XQX4_9PLEO|nr:unnamed protein product [Periconia digitata]
MANSTNSQAVMAELGGNHQQHHKLNHDTPYQPHHSGKHYNASTSNTTPTVQGSSSEEASNGDEEADSSTTQGDDQDEDEEEPEVFAPSHGRGKGKGKGKRPAIRVDPVEDDESEAEENDTVPSAMGLFPRKHTGNHSLTTNKKRTFSNVSNTSLLFGDDESEKSFPRRKMARKLSNSNIKPLLQYKENASQAVENSETAIESDDEDYSGVNLVPDDDDYEQEEESFIMQDALDDNNFNSFMGSLNDARRLSLESHVSDSIFDMTAPLSGAYLEDLSFTHDHPGFGQFFEQSEALPLSPPSPDPIAKRKYSDSSTKRVRFDDEVQMSDSSSASSSELDSSLYPDLFLEQDKLPPSLTQLLDIDYDEDNADYDSAASDKSFWDYGQDETRHSAPSRPNPLKAIDDLEDDESSDPGSSGYETDIGDTTDEYESDAESLANPQTPLQKKSVLHRPSSAPASRISSPIPFARSSRPSGRAIPPTRGIFIHDDSNKAIAVTNRKTKALTFYRPRVSGNPWVTSFGPQSSSNSTTNSPRNSVQQYNNGSDSEVSNEVFNNPYTTDIMLTGIFGGAPTDEYFFGADSVGPPEAFYPFVAVGTNGAIVDEEGEYDEEEDYEDDLNITDFMDFGDDADDTDVDQEDDETDAPATPAASTMAMNGSTPARPTPMSETPSNRKRNASDAMLQHFDRGVVTAFRNNQTRYRDVACLPSDPSIRASVSKPIRSGKSAEQLMTPLRKRSGPKRPAKSPFQPSSPMVHASSPLNGVTRASSRLSALTSHRTPKMGTFS